MNYNEWMVEYKVLISDAFEQASAFGYYGNRPITALEICNEHTGSNSYEKAIQDWYALPKGEIKNAIYKRC